MMCGIDDAVRYIRETCQDAQADLVINRLEYHRNQAEGQKPRYHAGQGIKYYYTCRNCGKTVQLIDNYCSGCGFAIQWDSVRCLTGLPLVDAAEAMT